MHLCPALPLPTDVCASFFVRRGRLARQVRAQRWAAELAGDGRARRRRARPGSGRRPRGEEPDAAGGRRRPVPMRCRRPPCGPAPPSWLGKASGGRGGGRRPSIPKRQQGRKLKTF
ncbi:hypothetical protein BS78_02G385600 [Paspalum vaginatum]|nr:hypothetical protein BS78_02G385600 [Paspalum vaginatum]